MHTSTDRVIDAVAATGVRFQGDILHIELSDGREVSIPVDRMDWLSWLAAATPAQRSHWTIEPGGFAVYWNDLDNGIEICHLLGMHPLA